MNDSNSIRLNKYISESGMCSRREADRFIEQGVVFINGQRAKIGRQVFPGDKVVVNGNEIEAKKEADSIYIAFNKPPGITCTTEEGVRDNIVNFIRYGQRIFPIGRLDKDSQGLIFLTNNGDIVNKILRAGNNHEKEYLVTVNKAITDDFIIAMGNGVPVLGQTTKKCVVKKESTFVFRIILIQGLNRQIRRMCEYFKYEVVKLERVRIMNISLKGIPVGEYREFSPKEIESVNELIKHSGGTEDASRKKSSHKNQQPQNNPTNQPKTRNRKPKTKNQKHSGSIEGKNHFRKFKDDEMFRKKNNSPNKNSSNNNKNKGGKRSGKKSPGRWDLL